MTVFHSLLLAQVLLFMANTSTIVAFSLPSLTFRPTVTHVSRTTPIVAKRYSCSLLLRAKAHSRLQTPVHCSSESQDGIGLVHPTAHSLPPEPTSTTTGMNQKIVVVLDESDLDERFVRCTGNGGQKVNKSSSKVDLVHKPTGIKVSCQDFRDLSSNRARARKLLTAKLDLHFNGKASKIGMKHDLVRKRKKNAARKAKKKYANDGTQAEATDIDEAAQDDLVVQNYLQQVR